MVNIVYNNCISVAFAVNISVLYMKFMTPPLPLFERIIPELYHCAAVAPTIFCEAWKHPHAVLKHTCACKCYIITRCKTFSI